MLLDSYTIVNLKTGLLIKNVQNKLIGFITVKTTIDNINIMLQPIEALTTPNCGPGNNGNTKMENRPPKKFERPIQKSLAFTTGLKNILFQFAAYAPTLPYWYRL